MRGQRNAASKDNVVLKTEKAASKAISASLEYCRALRDAASEAMTRVLSDGVWFGTPHDLGREWDTQRLAQRIGEMTHEHLLLYGKLDYWIPLDHVERMAERLPNAKLDIFPFIGHSMCIENPLLLARIFFDFFAADPVGARPSVPGEPHGALQ